MIGVESGSCGVIHLDLRVDRHVGFQIVAAVVDIDLDAIDQLHAFLVSLDLLGRELGFGRDEGDAAGISFAGKRVGGERRRTGRSFTRPRSVSLM